MAKYFDEYSDTELYKMLCEDKYIAEQAFTEIFNRYSSRIYAYCRRFLGDREEALDAFQETFIRFHQSASKDREMTNLPGFLLTIARNLCMNIKRKERNDISYEDYMAGNDDENKTDKNEMLDLIKKALNQLPDDYREVFILREYEGLSYQEIANMTNTNITNVKVRIHRAKQKIRDILQPYMSEL